MRLITGVASRSRDLFHSSPQNALDLFRPSSLTSNCMQKALKSFIPSLHAGLEPSCEGAWLMIGVRLAKVVSTSAGVNLVMHVSSQSQNIWSTIRSKIMPG